MSTAAANIFGDIDRPNIREYLGDKLWHPERTVVAGRLREFTTQEEIPNVVDWMDDNFKLSAATSNNPGPWTTAAFQRGPTFSMAALHVRLHVEQKGSQVGATKRVTGVLGYDLAVRRRKCISWNPTLEDARDYSQSHFFSMLEDCKVVRAAMLVRDIYRRSVYNRLTRRMFRGAVIWFRTASTAQAFQRLTADTGVVDDFDRVPKEIQSTSGDEDEGSVEALAEKRLRTSPNPKLILISTPTGEGESLIAERVDACPHVFRRQVKAPCCGALQELEFGYPTAVKTGDAGATKEPAHGLVYDHAEGLDPESRAKGCRYKCKHCEDSFTYEQLDDADRGGRWISEKSGLVQDDADGSYYELATGRRAFPEEVAYVYSSLLSRQEKWSKVCSDYLAAVRDIGAGSYGRMKVFVNQTLAQVYRRPVIDRVETSELLKRLEDYGAECPPCVQAIVLAIDKQHRYFDFEFVGFGARRESWGLLTGTIAGRTTDAEDESWKALSALTRKTFTKANGEQMPVNIVMIDEGDDSGNVVNWCSVAPIHRIPCKGFGTFNHELVRKRNALPDLRTGTSPHNIGVHAASEKFYDMLAITEPEESDDYTPGDPIPGYCHFSGDPAHGYFEPAPAHDPNASPTSTYFDQVTAAEKTIGRRSGQRAVIYITPDGVRDEKHDERKMSLAGLEILIQNGFRLLDVYDPGSGPEGGAMPLPAAAAPAAAPFTVAQAYSK